jgi:hypothetical protein
MITGLENFTELEPFFRIIDKGWTGSSTAGASSTYDPTRRRDDPRVAFVGTRPELHMRLTDGIWSFKHRSDHLTTTPAPLRCLGKPNLR